MVSRSVYTIPRLLRFAMSDCASLYHVFIPMLLQFHSFCCILGSGAQTSQVGFTTFAEKVAEDPGPDAIASYGADVYVVVRLALSSIQQLAKAM